MREALKNMFRRKTRTILTIFGITIGIFAFTVMGSMAEKISLLVSGGTEYYKDKVTVSQTDSLIVQPPMNVNKAAEIRRVAGVAEVSGTIFTSLEDSFDAVSLGPPAGIVATDFNSTEFETFKITYSGRAIRPGDDGNVAVGSDLVKKLSAAIGGTVKVRGKDYKVVGILNKTLTSPDNEVFMTLHDAQQVYYNEQPEVIRAQTNPSDIVNGFNVYIKPGFDPNSVAKTINAQVKEVHAFGPQDFQDQIGQATGIFNAILFGVAIISLIVGGLSVMNTMTMSISERTREIGIKKAMGAKTKNILAEYLTEAGLIGLFGGLIGWGLGALTILAVNGALEDSGNVIFLLSTRITIFAIVFAVVLGIIAGFYPAYRAAKINIVKALRNE